MLASMTSVQQDIDLIRHLIEWSGETAAAIAREIGVANTTINRFKLGTATTRLGRGTVDKLRARYPNFPPFADGETDDGQPSAIEYVSVSVLPSYAGMGGGGNGEGEPQTARLPARLIREELRGRPEDFELIDVRGDSMMPDFHHGDQILIDRRDRNPRQPGPFALWDEDGYVIKLVERIPGRRGWYRIFSANERYSAYEIEETESTIRGRPVWFARRL